VMPGTVFIDAEGNIVDRVSGKLQRADFTARLKKLAGEPAVGAGKPSVHGGRVLHERGRVLRDPGPTEDHSLEDVEPGLSRIS